MFCDLCNCPLRFGCRTPPWGTGMSFRLNVGAEEAWQPVATRVTRAASCVLAKMCRFVSVTSIVHWRFWVGNWQKMAAEVLTSSRKTIDPYCSNKLLQLVVWPKLRRVMGQECPLRPCIARGDCQRGTPWPCHDHEHPWTVYAQNHERTWAWHQVSMAVLAIEGHKKLESAQQAWFILLHIIWHFESKLLNLLL